MSDAILVIGLGNPLLGDDSIGWRVVERVGESLPYGHAQVELDCLAVGGLSLMERLIGYRRVILVDSMALGQGPRGSVYVFPLSRLENPGVGHSTAPHDTSLQTALDLGRQMGAALPDPENIVIVGVESEWVYDFSEELTPEAAAALPQAVEQVLNLIQTWNEGVRL